MLQHPVELEWFIDLLRWRRVRSYLEVGVRFGETFAAVLRGVESIQRAVAVDIELTDELRRVEAHACIDLIEGNSGDVQTFMAALSNGYPEAVLIDGDHRYDAVRRDWELYGPHAKIVAFHDIAKEEGWVDRDGVPIEVPRLWREIRGSRAVTVELVAPGSFMGIGVLMD
jgi:cephalosporin hydroxylase